ncbi:MAG: glycine cleavage system aminomethyltransferase GcvT [Anaerolineales bacterium]|nr:glycine cleavage system aminomethyltransferase GcvT [Anaerolineales bacterium]
MGDFLVRGTLAKVDPAVEELIRLESERQYRKLILIPSESTAPRAVLEALGSRLQNLYAEGYPDEETRRMSEEEILDFPARLGHFRRYSDPRYYKGVEYADILEALARRRCAEAFATEEIAADGIYVNVQALSGAPANTAVYDALVNPGDTVMGLNLLHGGHLTHGSPVNRSGRWYKIVAYTIDPATEKLDYDAIEALACEHKPKMIIAGYTSYPWAADWKRFRRIADAVGAYLVADIAHVAGMVVAGAYPTPVGHAHAVTFTTHKTLCGPRGACILTTDPALARKIDRGVFPGEQGGPHVNVFAALAVMFKIARTEKFRELQHQIVRNAKRLSDSLEARGLKIAYGGTDTHLLNVDCKSIRAPDGTPLSGDIAARVLDLAGIVANRNTIPGDPSAGKATGVRMGTPWATQRGLREADMDALAEVITQVLQACHPFQYSGRKGSLLRARIDFTAMEDARIRVRSLAEKAGIDFKPDEHGYPHFYYLDDPLPKKKFTGIAVAGPRAEDFLYWATVNDVYALKTGKRQPTKLPLHGGITEAVLERAGADEFLLTVPSARANLALAWLRALSDGYVRFDDDLVRKIPGPVRIDLAGGSALMPKAAGPSADATRPYCLAPFSAPAPGPLPEFAWKEPADPPLRFTPLHAAHLALGAKMVPFAGWEMPVWYDSVVEEHLAVRKAAGLFDVAHMGVWEASGDSACAFLDAVCANEVAALAPGQSLYTHLLDPDGKVIDDLMIYRRGNGAYLIVVNAANDEKDWAWVNAVREGKVRIDRDRPGSEAPGRKGAVLRNLRDPASDADRRVDIALQGPKSLEILQALGGDAETKRWISRLARTELCDAVLGGFDLIVARTGYTGESAAYELFVHPDRAADLWSSLIKAGAPLGLKPAGLGARDSLRTEAGLPLYGHEFAGPLNLGVGDGGFESYVKPHKPWFIGRQAFLEQERNRKSEVVRFRFNRKGVRMAHPGDVVTDEADVAIGKVTSCAIDGERFLLGQAYLENDFTKEGRPIIVRVGGRESGEAAKEPATVLSRFPKKAKK